LFFFASRRRHTRSKRDWSSDVCSSDLQAVFAPLGRMALSNYLGATILIIAVRLVVPDLSRFDAQGGYVAGLIACLAILALQMIVSSLWLRRFGQGPLEKLWRRVTWGRPAERISQRHHRE